MTYFLDSFSGVSAMFALSRVVCYCIPEQPTAWSLTPRLLQAKVSDAMESSAIVTACTFLQVLQVKGAIFKVN